MTRDESMRAAILSLLVELPMGKAWYPNTIHYELKARGYTWSKGYVSTKLSTMYLEGWLFKPSHGLYAIPIN